MRKALRLVSLAMLIIAAIFYCCCLVNPALGGVIYIGNLRIGYQAKEIIYLGYFMTVFCCFIVSFFCKKN